MKFLSGQDIRRAFLQFYADREHKLLPSASLIPDDPTVLLTIAGMLPFKPVFLGQRERPAARATTAQKCVRTNDVENVGRTARHHTFFEMLGNFSFGDYFKKEAIRWAWELLTDVYGIPASRLWVSVYEADNEAFILWQDTVGLPPERIQRMGADSNFWASGPTGPCGPCSEIYFDFLPERVDAVIDLDDDTRFLEIYNLVFMESNRDVHGNLTPLAKQNIDTGLGLERLAQVLQGVPNNYETDLVFPIIEKVGELAGLDYHQATEEQKRSFKIVGDHVRAVVHLITDGVTPSNIKRGYILRGLIRRAIRHGRLLGITEPFLPQVAEIVIAMYLVAYPQVQQKAGWIHQVLQVEETQFRRTLDVGERLLLQILARTPEMIDGEELFILHDTHGFPPELTEEIAREQGIKVDWPGYEQAREKAQQLSRDSHVELDLTTQLNLPATEFLGYTLSESSGFVVALFRGDEAVEHISAGDQGVKVILNQTPFYAESGGQVGDTGKLLNPQIDLDVLDVQKQGDVFVHHLGEIKGVLSLGDTVVAKVNLDTRRRAQAHHTATHLLNAALRQVVDPNVSQAGSLVAFDRLRFDFNCPRAVTEAELETMENLINQWITASHPLLTETLPIEAARDKGAVAMFGEKYGANVRVVDVPGVSMEFCGGIHVTNTAEIGIFKIMSEAGVASGIRRIEAVAGPAVLDYLKVRDRITRQLSSEFKVTVEEIPQRVTGLQQELRRTQKEMESLRAELAIVQALALAEKAIQMGQTKLLTAILPNTPPEALKTAAERLSQKLGESAVVLGSAVEGKTTLVAAFSPLVVKQGGNAGKFIGQVAGKFGARGGGRPNLAQAGGIASDQLTAALAFAQQLLLDSIPG
jgi:alanyl-tRNA synthetase